MRSDKELGEILLNNQSGFSVGLCGWISVLFAYNFITENERDYLHEKVRNNRPKYKSIKHSFYNPDKVQKYGNGLYWKMGYIKPRIKWIKKHLIKE